MVKVIEIRINKEPYEFVSQQSQYAGLTTEVDLTELVSRVVITRRSDYTIADVQLIFTNDDVYHLLNDLGDMR
jgi:hypothetical protein